MDAFLATSATVLRCPVSTLEWESGLRVDAWVMMPEFEERGADSGLQLHLVSRKVLGKFVGSCNRSPYACIVALQHHNPAMVAVASLVPRGTPLEVDQSRLYYCAWCHKESYGDLHSCMGLQGSHLGECVGLEGWLFRRARENQCVGL